LNCASIIRAFRTFITKTGPRERLCTMAKNPNLREMTMKMDTMVTPRTDTMRIKSVKREKTMDTEGIRKDIQMWIVHGKIGNTVLEK